MSSVDSQERLKEEAKTIKEKIGAIVKDSDDNARMVRTLSIYAGMLTETLLEYEEPDLIMEQSFHRVSDLINAEPYDGSIDSEIMPLAYVLDNDTEVGRAIARKSSEKMHRGLDDLHEISIGLIITAIPEYTKLGYSKEKLLLLLIEMVIAAITFEMATQDFCDVIVEDFMSKDDAEGYSPSEAIVSLSSVAGYYYAIAKRQMNLPEDADINMINVMVRESLRHGTTGTKNWNSLAASNDVEDGNIARYLNDLKPSVEEFFDLIGQDDPLGRAVSIAKAVGRMVAVISIEDIGHIHPSIAKSLAKTGMILGLNYREEVLTA